MGKLIERSGKMSSSDIPLNMLQQNQKETQSVFVVPSGHKAAQIGKNNIEDESISSKVSFIRALAV